MKWIWFSIILLNCGSEFVSTPFTDEEPTSQDGGNGGGGGNTTPNDSGGSGSTIGGSGGYSGEGGNASSAGSGGDESDPPCPFGTIDCPCFSNGTCNSGLDCQHECYQPHKCNFEFCCDLNICKEECSPGYYYAEDHTFESPLCTEACDFGYDRTTVAIWDIPECDSDPGKYTHLYLCYHSDKNWKPPAHCILASHPTGIEALCCPGPLYP